jgi:phosphate transport system protein
LQNHLTQLRKQILEVGAVVEDSLAKALTALLTRRLELGEAVMNGDAEIDRLEIDVEEECLKILALNHPVADDLRFIVAVLKMNNDLERMGDHAANIAKRAVYLAKRDPVEWPDGIEQMGQTVRLMLKQSLDALVEADGRLAREVCAGDDIVDGQKRQLVAALRERLLLEQGDKSCLLKMLDVPRHLERIADLSTNIAEDVIYLVDGAIIRHHHYEAEESAAREPESEG